MGATRSVAQLVAPAPSEFTLIARGTPLRSAPVAGTSCQFRTVYPVLAGPVRILEASYHAGGAAPAGARLPRGAIGVIAIDIELKGTLAELCERGAGCLRVFVDGDPALRAALIDALCMRAAAAWAGSSRLT